MVAQEIAAKSLGREDQSPGSLSGKLGKMRSRRGTDVKQGTWDDRKGLSHQKEVGELSPRLEPVALVRSIYDNKQAQWIIFEGYDYYTPPQRKPPDPVIRWVKTSGQRSPHSFEVLSKAPSTQAARMQSVPEGAGPDCKQTGQYLE